MKMFTATKSLLLFSANKMASPLIITKPEAITLVPSIEHDFATSLNNENIPTQFIWPEEDRYSTDAMPELHIPEIDISSFFSDGQDQAVVVDEVCREHGLFLVKNHGVDMGMVEEAYIAMDLFFSMPLVEKQKAQRKAGEPVGYASSFTGRFSNKLPWKETLSLRYCEREEEEDDAVDATVENYLLGTMGDGFLSFGKLWDKYCKAMSKLSMEIMEVLGISLGVGGGYFQKFFRCNESVLRMNYYPQCYAPQLTLGTGPHSDPTSLTVLYQPTVAGLQVLVDHTWHSVPPYPHGFVVNIGDTLSALTNGVYKPCMHRAVVNNKEIRKSIAFFLSPHKDMVVRASEQMVVSSGGKRLYPDFTWPLFHHFTQKNYRCDMSTLLNFSNWIAQSNNSSKIHNHM